MKSIHNQPSASPRRGHARRGKQRGQGMAEYIIIVALVAVAGIATWELVGSSIGQSAAGVAASIAGFDGNNERNAAAATAGAAVQKAAEVKNLATYADANQAGNQN